MSAARRARQRARRTVDSAIEQMVVPAPAAAPTEWERHEAARRAGRLPDRCGPLCPKPPEPEPTAWWQGEPVTARKVAGRFGADWRPLVEITDRYERVRYIDDIDGRGWAKVTVHRGAPSAWHRDMRPQEVKPHA